MATARMTSVREESPASAEEISNAVLVSAMAGSRAMAIIAGEDDDAATVAQAVGSGMEAAGAVVMVAIAHPGATLRDLIDQVAPTAAARSPAALALKLLQGEDAGLFTVLQAQFLDPEVLENLLSLSQANLGNDQVLQVLLAGNADLNAQLDRHANRAAADRVHVLRWLLASQPDVRKAAPVMHAASAPRPKTALAGTSRRRSSRLASALGLMVAAAAAGWFAADGFLTEAFVAAIKMPAAEAPSEPASIQLIAATHSPAPSPTPSADLLISTDHGPMPTVRPGETVVFQVETGTDKFVYCYYMDGSRQVARIFPNRFQPDAFVPAGQKIQIPPGPEPERPFNIRLETAGRLEAIACLASPTELDGNRIDGTDIRDLTPIPGLGLQDLVDTFGRLSATGASSQTMPINVRADADSRMHQR